jgi:hypothetical protein
MDNIEQNLKVLSVYLDNLNDLIMAANTSTSQWGNEHFKGKPKPIFSASSLTLNVEQLPNKDKPWFG